MSGNYTFIGCSDIIIKESTSASQRVASENASADPPSADDRVRNALADLHVSDDDDVIMEDLCDSDGDVIMADAK